jgi:outer membrane receptor protein involved in Fe transport
MSLVTLKRMAALASVSGAALLAASPALAQAAGPADAQGGGPAVGQQVATPDSPDDMGQTIVVRGVRGSLLRSIEAKRSSGTIIDAISAEELGKFPDRNVAEALGNIPGVTVGRDGRGEGRNVTIRGLGEEFAITTLNGRILPTFSTVRALAFYLVPSVFFWGAVVRMGVL